MKRFLLFLCSIILWSLNGQVLSFKIVKDSSQKNSLQAQKIIQGEVMCKGLYIQDAAVYSRLTPSGVITDILGQFTIRVDSIEPGIVVQKPGYEVKSIKTQKSGSVIVELKKVKPGKYKSFTRENRCCFIRGTKILLGNGTLKNIESIVSGDSILNMNLNNVFSFQKASVIKIDSVLHNNLVELELENKIKVTSTSDHPYFIAEKGWCSFDPKSTFANCGIKAQQLNIGDRCLVYTNGDLIEVTVKDIKRIKGHFMTYNLTGLSHNNTYFVNRILVNNESDQRIIISP